MEYAFLINGSSVKNTALLGESAFGLMTSGLNKLYHYEWLGGRIFREPSLAGLSAIANTIGLVEHFYPPRKLISKKRPSDLF